MKRRSIICVCLTMFALLLLFGKVDAEAASNHMSKYRKQFALKKNKTTYFDNRYAGLGMKKQSVKITNYKVKNSSKKGYKVATFKITVKDTFKPTASQVHTMANNAYNGSVYNVYFAVVDYKTGLALSDRWEDYKDWEDSDFYDYDEYVEEECYGGVDYDGDTDVKVVHNGWNFSSYKYQDYDGCWVTMGTHTIRVKVIYPKDYKRACLVVGGLNKSHYHTKDNKFIGGSLRFGKTNLAKNKNCFKAMRIK